MFPILQISRGKSAPVYLYEVTHAVGVGGRILMTSGERSVTISGEEYRPYQVAHGGITSSGSLDKTMVDITTDRRNPLVELFRTYPPDTVVSVVIHRGEAFDTDLDFRAIWSGRILNFSLNGNEASFSAEPLATAMRRPGLRRTYQYGCPHVLYGPHCRANKADASQTVTLSGINGSVLTLPGSWYGANSPSKYVKGLVEWDLPAGGSTSRTILQVLETGGSYQDVLLAGLPSGLSTGDTVRVVLGCNRQTGDCLNLHNNIVNYGGQPWISQDNPLGQKNIFY